MVVGCHYLAAMGPQQKAGPVAKGCLLALLPKIHSGLKTRLLYSALPQELWKQDTEWS